MAKRNPYRGLSEEMLRWARQGARDDMTRIKAEAERKIADIKKKLDTMPDPDKPPVDTVQPPPEPTKPSRRRGKNRTPIADESLVKPHHTQTEAERRAARRSKRYWDSPAGQARRKQMAKRRRARRK